WHGKYINSHADKNMGPPLEGTMLVSAKVGPGWSRRSDWDDPRTTGEGPLPRSWARYQGLYLHGDAVVLRLTVGGVDVFESFSGTEQGDQLSVARHFTFGPSREALQLFVPDAVQPGRLQHFGEPKPTSREETVHGQKGTVFEFPPMPNGGRFRVTYLQNLKEPNKIVTPPSEAPSPLLDATRLTN